jgi:predicted Zn-dependent protease
VRKRLLLLPLLLTTLGCHGLRPTLPALPQRDGDGDAVRLHRLDQAAARLGVTGIEVALSPRAEPGAWAWPKGPIQVSRTLVDLVDDDELAAAIAHELGHLHGDGSLRGPLAALEGSRNPDVEARADEVGCQLLTRRGVPPAAIVSLLERLGASTRPDLFARVARARAACIGFNATPVPPARP